MQLCVMMHFGALHIFCFDSLFFLIRRRVTFLVVPTKVWKCSIFELQSIKYKDQPEIIPEICHFPSMLFHGRLHCDLLASFVSASEQLAHENHEFGRWGRLCQDSWLWNGSTTHVFLDIEVAFYQSTKQKLVSGRSYSCVNIFSAPILSEHELDR